MKLLVTGGQGFVGARLVQAASRAGHDVVSVSRRAPEGTDVGDVEKRVTRETCNLADRAAVSELFARVRPEGVLHAAARIPTRMGEDAFVFFDDNVRASLHVLDAANLHGASRVVLSSSMAVYGDPSYLPVDEVHPTLPTAAYGVSKLEAELYGRLYARRELQVTVLRYSGIFGVGQRGGAIPTFIARCRKNEPLLLHAGGRPSSDYVWAEDVAAANLLSLARPSEHDFRVYNIGGGEETSVATLARHVRTLTGSSSEIRLDDTPSPRDFRFAYAIRRATDEIGYVATPLEEALAAHLGGSAAP